MKRSDIPAFGSLDNLKVVVSATAIAGPVAGVIMAEAGADVILLENPKRPDMYRFYQYGWPQERRNLRTLSIDAFSEQGHEAVMRLIESADIFIESSIAGTWAKKGYSDEVLWERNPSLVIAHLSGFGQYGDPDMIKKPSYDNTGQFFSGYTIIQGENGTPRLVPALVSDYFTAYTTLWSALAAYIKAQETGEGESLDIAQYEATLRPQHFLTGEAFNKNVSGYTLQENNTPPCSMMFETKDGAWVMFAPIPTTVYPFLEMMGLKDDPDIPDDLVMLTKEMPLWQEHVYEPVKQFVAQRTRDEIEKIADENKFTFCAPLDYPDMLNHPHLQARETLITYHDDTIDGDFTGVAPVPKFTNHPQQIWRGGFTLGADNDDVLEELGYSADEVHAMYDQGILAKQA